MEDAIWDAKVARERAGEAMTELKSFMERYTPLEGQVLAARLRVTYALLEADAAGANCDAVLSEAELKREELLATLETTRAILSKRAGEAHQHLKLLEKSRPEHHLVNLSPGDA